MSSTTRWALEIAIVEYAKAPPETRDYEAVQKALNAHDLSEWQDGYRVGQIDCATDGHKA